MKGIGPGATSDGRTIVYVSTETGSNAGLWKADADGRNATQLVSGPIMIDPASTGNWVTVTPDDRQVVFVSLDGGLPAVWTVPLDGGTPAQLFEGLAVTPHVSPDGTLARVWHARCAESTECDGMRFPRLHRPSNV